MCSAQISLNFLIILAAEHLREDVSVLLSGDGLAPGTTIPFGCFSL
jgi:hypothetical protein